MKKKFFLLTILTFVVILSCKKNDPQDPQIISESNKVNKNLKKIFPSSYQLNPEQTTSIIKAFKLKATENNLIQNRLIDADSVSLDSSVWVLEAALNYDFDYVFDENYETSIDTIDISIALNDESFKVHSDDLEDVYNDLHSSIEGIINDSIKVLVVDVEGYIYVPGESTAMYQISIVTLNSNKINPCSDFSGVTASPWLSLYSGPALNCSGNPTLDGPQALNGKMNCVSYNPGNCGYDYYYTNVVNVVWLPNTSGVPGVGTNNYPNALYSTQSLQTNAALCQNYQSISTSQLNTYKSNCNSLVSSAIPGTPANMKIIHKYLTPHQDLCVCIPTARSVYWKLQAKYGTVTCFTRED